MHAHDADGALIYAGIDEAGYGPRLGPLCVAMAVFSVAGAAHEPPDLWRALRKAVCRKPPRRGQRIAVDDSKNLMSAAGGRSTAHLERAVHAFLRTTGRRPTTDADLFAALGASADRGAWYQRTPLPSPASCAPEQTDVAANLLKAAMRDAGVRTLDMRCASICEHTFNGRLDALGNKAAVNFEAVAAHLRTVWTAWGNHRPYVAVDRQGGRTFYADLLRAALPGAEIGLIERNRAFSIYEAFGAEPGDERRMTVEFRVCAETKHLPVALASMTAKLVREAAMARFNGYWTTRLPDLKPTAGYGADANRWLGDIAHVLADAERALLVRRA